MIRCQNCGQVNQANSNFCRFCGLKFMRSTPAPAAPPPRQNRLQISTQNRAAFDFAPPHPYSWKTDELNPEDQRRTRPIDQVQPLVKQPPLPTQKDINFSNKIARQNQNNFAPYFYKCPNCYSPEEPTVEKKISTAGWVVFAVLLLTIPFLFWIGFFIKEEVKTCPVCKEKIN